MVALEGDEGEEIEHGFGVAIMNRMCVKAWRRIRVDGFACYSDTC